MADGCTQMVSETTSAVLQDQTSSITPGVRSGWTEIRAPERRTVCGTSLACTLTVLRASRHLQVRNSWCITSLSAMADRWMGKRCASAPGSTNS